MGRTSVRVAREWTVAGYMNMVPGCGGPRCNPHRFPVDMPDGTQRTACLDHLPDTEFAFACGIIVGQEPTPGMEATLVEVDRAINRALPAEPAVLRELALEYTCRQMRSGVSA